MAPWSKFRLGNPNTMIPLLCHMLTNWDYFPVHFCNLWQVYLCVFMCFSSDIDECNGTQFYSIYHAPPPCATVSLCNNTVGSYSCDGGDFNLATSADLSFFNESGMETWNEVVVNETQVCELITCHINLRQDYESQHILPHYQWRVWTI